jgi:hypothetical protein
VEIRVQFAWALLVESSIAGAPGGSPGPDADLQALAV